MSVREGQGRKGRRVRSSEGAGPFEGFGLEHREIGPWRLSSSPAPAYALLTRAFRNLGLPDLAVRCWGSLRIQMKRVPHSHFGMPGSIQKHTLVYTVVLALVLTAFFDLTRIAALGIIFYLIMDIAVHWGMLALFAPRHSRQFTDPVHGNYARPIDTWWSPLGEDRVRSAGCDGGDSWHGNHSDGRNRIS